MQEVDFDSISPIFSSSLSAVQNAYRILLYISAIYFTCLTNYLLRGSRQTFDWALSEKITEMALAVVFPFLINLVLIQGRTEVGPGPDFRPDNYTHFDVYASALSRAHYNPWVCDYRSEPGYKCLSCSSALHCYPGNFALLVQCAGIFPFCRNGYCSRFKTEGCVEEADPSLVNHASTMPPYVQTFNKVNKTTVATNAPDDHEITEPILHDPIPQESASKPVATQSNDPNNISGEKVKPSNVPYVNKKPKDSQESPQISEEII